MRLLRRGLSWCLQILRLFGCDPLKTLRSFLGLFPYLRDLLRLRRQGRQPGRESFPLGRLHPCLDERGDAGGAASGHYFHQDLLVARRIYTLRPERHIDVGSRVDGFVAHVAVFCQIDVVDIRPQPAVVPNVSFLQADMMRPLRAELVACCNSLSCLHALEHFGLGRYGDSVDFDGHRRGLENLARLLRPAGRLYLSVPIGPQRIEFNAHRVFSVSGLLGMVSQAFTVDRFSYVDDRGDLHEDVPLHDDEVQRSYGCRFGCGILELLRRP